MKLRILVSALPALASLGQTKLPVRAAYAVGKATRLVQEELKTYDATRVQLIEAAGGALSEDGTQYTFTREAAAAFTKSHEELLDQEVDLPTLVRIPLDALGDVQVEPSVLSALDDWLITEE